MTSSPMSFTLAPLRCVLTTYLSRGTLSRPIPQGMSGTLPDLAKAEGRDPHRLRSEPSAITGRGSFRVSGCLYSPGMAEPTRPIVHIGTSPTDGGFFLYPYPKKIHAVGGFPVNVDECDGSWVYPHDFVRIEINAYPALDPGVDDDWDRGSPSEHFRFLLEVFAPAPDGKTRLDWDAGWVHQNRPERHRGAFEVVQSNQYHLSARPGLWIVKGTLTGQESGNHLEAQCSFTVPE
jgi:hypothetical protein